MIMLRRRCRMSVACAAVLRFGRQKGRAFMAFLMYPIMSALSGTVARCSLIGFFNSLCFSAWLRHQLKVAGCVYG
ncbi:hypothetical protein C8N36_13417 [Pelagimonas varians]|uniref:Uncharacterized protein n=1 Tax=Pelagimonas varians TaxID=696760 RepID=A0A238L6L7_9RHOB|nr:hypothetical protein C8N36_13417 [Pelagimonas varians]SMX50471.1 hypothetical protein PEV8663_04664 [Pelagimonas varians]